MVGIGRNLVTVYVYESFLDSFRDYEAEISFKVVEGEGNAFPCVIELRLMIPARELRLPT